MENALVVVKDNELFVGTWDLAQGFGVEHRALTRLIKKYKSEFEELGVVTTALQQLESKKGKKEPGRKVEQFLLCEEQAIYIVTLLTNTAQIREFKRKLSKEFLKQRRAIERLIASIRVNKQNAEWFEKRASGKIERRVETDAIKEFVEYSKTQGSKNADKYYMIISKMENNALFNLEFVTIEYSNLRDVVSGLGLDALKMADRIVAKALKDGMTLKMYYKDIFKMAKARVESFADSMGKILVQTNVNLVAI